MGIMEELLASQSFKPKAFEVGQEIEGRIISKTNTEIIVDFGYKSEGMINLRDLPEDKRQSIKVGDNIKAYLVELENSEGQAILSINKGSGSKKGVSGKQGTLWQKFTTAKLAQTVFLGKCVEVNKGGLILEVDGVRGFLPSSQLGGSGLVGLVGKDSPIGVDFQVKVSEVDQNGNRLIFTQKGINVEKTDLGLEKKLKGKISIVLPFGLIVEFEGGSGFISSQEVSWERVENLESKFKVGQELEATVIGIDEELGRLNLSFKDQENDPYSKYLEKEKNQEVIKGIISEIGDNGITVKLDENVTGFIPSSKVDSSASYELGQSLNVMIDSIDSTKRRINLAPFITTTKGLIYK